MAKLATSTELRSDSAIRYDNTITGRPFKYNDILWHTPERVNTYMVDCLKSYEITGANDERLWEQFQEDFEGWNNDLFELGDKTIRATLRYYMKDNGINIGGARYISEQLADVLKEDKYMEWPEEDITKQLKSGRTFNSFQNPAVRARIEASITIELAKIQTTMTPNSTTTSTTPQGVTPEPTLFSPTPLPTPPLPAQRPTAKAFITLNKLYNTEASKFGGEMYDILDFKLKIFRKMCWMADIQPYHYHEAFPMMLKGRAHQFYYRHLAERGLSFDDMIKRTKDYFHPAENYQLYLLEWNSTTLQSIIWQNPDKNLSQNLELLIDKLQEIQSGLFPDYQGDNILRNQLVCACQGVSACTIALVRPSATFVGVASDLRSAVGTEMRCWNSAPQQYYVRNSRGGHCGQGPHRGYRRGGYNRNKRCFVCSKVGCWSTKHSAQERKQQQNKWRRFTQENGRSPSVSDFAAFLMDFEGVDIGEWAYDSNDDDDRQADFEAWCAMNYKGIERSA